MLGQLLYLLFFPLAFGLEGLPPFQGPQCQCNSTTAWLDVVVLIEGTTPNRYSNLAADAHDALTAFTVTTMDSAQSDFTTRIGVVIYDDEATVHGPLGTVAVDDLLDLAFGPSAYIASQGTRTNLAAGLKLAVEQFNTAGRRPNVPKIILLMSSFYNPAGVESPTKIADDFKASGGIIINYKMTGLYGDDNRLIQQIASPGFELSDTDGINCTELSNVICQANCFCPRGYTSYKSNLRGLPVAGCYSAVNTPSTYEKATEICRQQGGIVASGESNSKMFFLNNLLSGYLASPVTHHAFIGLTRTGNNWTWSDGTPVTIPRWRCNSCMYPYSFTCVYSEVTQFDTLLPYGSWTPADCFMSYPFVCEIPPCDSVNYCPWQEIQQ